MMILSILPLALVTLVVTISPFLRGVTIMAKKTNVQIYLATRTIMQLTKLWGRALRADRHDLVDLIDEAISAAWNRK